MLVIKMNQNQFYLNDVSVEKGRLTRRGTKIGGFRHLQIKKQKIVKFEILSFLSRPCKNTNRRRQKFPKPAPKDLEEIDLCTTTEEKVASRGLEHPEVKGQKIVSEA